MFRTQTMEEELQKCPELRLEDIRALREWAKTQPHLPNIDEIPDLFLSLFLRRRYYSLERAKQTLDEYLTFKTMVPELLSDRDASGPEVLNYFDQHYSFPLENPDMGGNVVFFIAFRHNDPTNYSFDNSMKTWVIGADTWGLQNGSCNGVTIIFDQQNFTLGHLLRISLASVKKMNYYNKHCAPVSIKNIYCLNANPFTQKFLNFFQPLLDGDIFSKIRVFTASQIDEFYKYIPKEYIPNEYGGNAGTLEELTEKSIKILQRNGGFIKKLDSLKVDESKRRGPPKNTNNMFGLEGTFKKLSVD